MARVKLRDVKRGTVVQLTDAQIADGIAIYNALLSHPATRARREQAEQRAAVLEIVKTARTGR